MEYSQKPGNPAPRPSLVPAAHGKGTAAPRILDNLAGGASVRVPAQSKDRQISPMWLVPVAFVALGLLAYGLLSESSTSPPPLATSPPKPVSPPLAPSVSPVEEAHGSQAATITNAPQEPALGDTHTVLTNALEKDVPPPPQALNKALESDAPSPAVVHAAPAPAAASKEAVKATAHARHKHLSQGNTHTKRSKPDHDVEIIQVLVAHNAKLRAENAKAQAGNVKSPPPQDRASAPQASGEPAQADTPE